MAGAECGAVALPDAQNGVVRLAPGAFVRRRRDLHVVHSHHGVHRAREQVPALGAVQLEAVHAALPLMRQEFVPAQAHGVPTTTTHALRERGRALRAELAPAQLPAGRVPARVWTRRAHRAGDPSGLRAKEWRGARDSGRTCRACLSPPNIPAIFFDGRSLPPVHSSILNATHRRARSESRECVLLGRARACLCPPRVSRNASRVSAGQRLPVPARKIFSVERSSDRSDRS